LPVALGRRVRELRREKKISQEELAARAALHRNYVGSVERGERDIGITAASQLARALGLSLSELFAPFRQR
jgi:transcriptional regulator with XRE-family HTH domain